MKKRKYHIGIKKKIDLRKKFEEEIEIEKENRTNEVIIALHFVISNTCLQ